MCPSAEAGLKGWGPEAQVDEQETYWWPLKVKGQKRIETSLFLFQVPGQRVSLSGFWFSCHVPGLCELLQFLAVRQSAPQLEMHFHLPPF